jgi:hypothetical protein
LESSFTWSVWAAICWVLRNVETEHVLIIVSFVRILIKSGSPIFSFLLEETACSYKQKYLLGVMLPHGEILRIVNTALGGVSSAVAQLMREDLKSFELGCKV